MEDLSLPAGAYRNDDCYKFWAKQLKIMTRDEALRIVDDKDNDGHTALHNAIIAGHVSVVEELLLYGANIEERVTGKPNNWTAIHFASFHGNEAAVKILIDHKADINIKEDKGLTPLHIAIKENHLTIAEMLILQGAEVNTKNNNGLTPLHEAARNGEKELAELLLDHGAEVHSVSKDNNTPLSLAVKEKYSDIADMLKSKGAK